MQALDTLLHDNHPLPWLLLSIQKYLASAKCLITSKLFNTSSHFPLYLFIKIIIYYFFNFSYLRALYNNRISSQQKYTSVPTAFQQENKQSPLWLPTRNEIFGFWHYPRLSTDTRHKNDYICLSWANSNLSITGWIILVSIITFMAHNFFPASLLDAPQWYACSVGKP